MRGRKTELAHELRLGAPLEVEAREIGDQPPRLGCQRPLSDSGMCRGHGELDFNRARPDPSIVRQLRSPMLAFSNYRRYDLTRRRGADAVNQGVAWRGDAT